MHKAAGTSLPAFHGVTHMDGYGFEGPALWILDQLQSDRRSCPAA